MESSVSSLSSRASRIRESRVKVRLAQLALCHEEEKRKEEEIRQKEEEIRRKEEEERRRQQAHEKRKRDKQGDLEMAQAELEAWEAESVSGAWNMPLGYGC